jgi:hypothetical protein
MTTSTNLVFVKTITLFSRLSNHFEIFLSFFGVFLRLNNEMPRKKILLLCICNFIHII